MCKYIYQALLFVSYSMATLCYANDHFALRDQRYHIHPGDVVAVNYRYSPEYNASVSVQPDGYITLPLLGDLKVSDLTLSEAHDQVLAKARERLNDPEITIDLKEFEKPYYIVGGEVGTPGKYEIHGHMTALRAVEIAGGLKGSAKSSQILLIRPVNRLDAETKLINLKEVINKQNLNEDVEIRAGDVIVVPKTHLAKVEPYVRLLNAGFYLNPTTF